MAILMNIRYLNLYIDSNIHYHSYIIKIKKLEYSEGKVRMQGELLELPRSRDGLLG